MAAPGSPPSWFAAPTPAELLWVSDPGRLHSRNLAARPEISIVVFDSTVPPYTGQALYMEATAGEVGEPDLERAIAAFASASLADGAGSWALDDVRAPADLRLYRAGVSQHWVLGEGDERIAVGL